MTYASLRFFFLDANLAVFRDPHNPSLSTKQILSVAPILKGQKVSHQFDIPKRSSVASPKAITLDFGNMNLIDFDDDDTERQIQYTKPRAYEAAVDLLGGDGNGGNAPDLVNHGGMMAPLQPTISPQQQKTLRRKDSASSDIDEFVDAEG